MVIEGGSNDLIDSHGPGRRVDRNAEDLELIGNLDDYELSPWDGIEGVQDCAPADRLVFTGQHVPVCTNTSASEPSPT